MRLSESLGEPSAESLPAAPDPGEVSRLARESRVPVPKVGDEPEPAVPEGGESVGELDEEVASLDDDEDCTTIIAEHVQTWPELPRAWIWQDEAEGEEVNRQGQKWLNSNGRSLESKVCQNAKDGNKHVQACSSIDLRLLDSERANCTRRKVTGP